MSLGIADLSERQSDLDVMPSTDSEFLEYCVLRLRLVDMPRCIPLFALGSARRVVLTRWSK